MLQVEKDSKNLDSLKRMICDHRLVDSYNSRICNLPCKLDTSIHRVPGMLRKYQTPSPSMFHPQKINFMDKIMSKHVYINLSLHHLGGIYKMLMFSNGWSIFLCFLIIASWLPKFPKRTFAKVLGSTVALGPGTSFQHSQHRVPG